MSRAAVQSLTILAVAVGAVVTVEEEGLAGENLPAVLYARETGNKVVEKWPVIGSQDKAILTCFRHCKNLHNEFESSAAMYSSLCLISMARLLLTDLSERILSVDKQKILEPLTEAIDGIHELLDPDGDRYDVYEEAERLAGVVKDEISF